MNFFFFFFLIFFIYASPALFFGFDYFTDMRHRHENVSLLGFGLSVGRVTKVCSDRYKVIFISDSKKAKLVTEKR
jgi:hypothetical protein